jgi:hypothetical protein
MDSMVMVGRQVLYGKLIEITPPPLLVAARAAVMSGRKAREWIRKH